MKYLRCCAVVLFAALSIGRIEASQSDVVPRLIDVGISSESLSSEVREYIERNGRSQYVDWIIPIRIDEGALKYDQFEAYIYDRNVQIRRRPQAGGERGESDPWRGDVVLPGDQHGRNYDGMRDVIFRNRPGRGLAGSIRINQFVYEIRRVESSQYVLSRLDVTKLGEQSPSVLFPDMRIEPPLQLEPSNFKADEEGDAVTIRLLVGFTPAALAAAGGEYTDFYDAVNDAIESAHQGYTQNGIDLSLEIAAYALPPYIAKYLLGKR